MKRQKAFILRLHGFPFLGAGIIKHTDECIQAIEESIWDSTLSCLSIEYDTTE